MNDDCVFCRIVSGRLPSETVLATPEVRCFLDTGPIVKGHVLVIPTAHYERLTDVPAPILHSLMDVAQRVTRILFREFRADGVNVFQSNGAAAGQIVPHAHFHVIPRFHHDGHRWNWTSGSYANAEEAAAFGNRLRSSL